MAKFRRGPRAPAVDPYQTDADFDAALLGLRAYTQQFWDIFHPDDPYVGGYPMDCICAHYEEWMDPDGSIQNLIVNQPFRTGKSTLLIYAMTYRWLTHPATRWMFATYNQGLSTRDSIRCRKLIRHPRYQAMVRRFTGQPLTINADQDTQRLFVNNFEGFRMALTVGKGLGEGGHYLVIDDPIDPTKARHRSQREFCVDWYRSTWRHRTAGDPKKVRRLVVQQRINQADLSGYLMENEGHEWQQLVLPMRYEPKRIVFGPIVDQEKATTQTDGEVNAAVLAKQMAGQADKATDPIRFTSLQNRVEKWQDNAKGSGRVNSGDLLWPQRFPESWVRSTESTLGKDAAGQLQQRPSSATGNVFRVEKAGAAVGRFDVTEKFLGIELFSSDGTARLMPADHWRWFQIGDTATKTSQENSYTVIGTFALSDDGKLVLWHIFRDRLEVPDQYPAIKEMKRGPCTWNGDDRKAVRLGTWPAPLLARYLEPKSSGIGLIQTSIIDGEPIRSLDKVPGDKVERAGHAAALYEAGSMYHRAGPWLSTAVEELRLFPNADFDDVADVVSYAGHVAATDKLLRAHINRRVVLNIQENKAAERQRAAIPEAALDAIMG